MRYIIAIVLSTLMASTGFSVVVQVSTQDDDTCVLSDTGQIKCFGANRLNFSESGNRPNSMGSNLPFIDLGQPASKICGGVQFHCALLKGGDVKCWGINNFGQLGLGDSLNRFTSEQLGNQLPIALLGAQTKIKDITCGAAHACALTTTGQVKCWGRNDSGELGRGDDAYPGIDKQLMGDQLKPIDFGDTVPAINISAGTTHTCAVFETNAVKCWGANEVGQLGLGDDIDRGMDPEEMGRNLPAVLLPKGIQWRSVHANERRTCAIGSDQNLYCWGNLERLGGDPGDFIIGISPKQMGDALKSVPLGTGAKVRQVDLSSTFSCAILTDGTTKCWGSNLKGTLAVGDELDHGITRGQMGDQLPFADLGLPILSLSIRGNLHGCAVLVNHQIKCWGDGYYGQIGAGDREPRGNSPGTIGEFLPTVDLGL